MNFVDEDKRLVERVGVRFTRFEHDRLVEEAYAHGLTVSKLVRAKVTGAKITSKIDVRAIAEIRRQGGLLKHLAQESKVDRAQVADALRRLVETIQSLTK